MLHSEVSSFINFMILHGSIADPDQLRFGKEFNFVTGERDNPEGANTNLK